MSVYSNQMNLAPLPQHQPQLQSQSQSQAQPSPYSNNTIISPLNNVPLSTPPPQYYMVNKNMTPPSTYLSYPDASPATMGMNTTMGAMPTPANNAIINPVYQTPNTNSVMLPPSVLQQNTLNHAYTAPVFSYTLSPPSLPNHDTNDTGIPMTMTPPTVLPSNSNATPIISTPHTLHTTPLISNPLSTGILPTHINTPIATTTPTILPNDLSSSSTPVISTELGNSMEIGTPLVMNSSMAVIPSNEMGTPLHGATTPGIYTLNSTDPSFTANASTPLVISSDANSGIILESPQVASMGTPITRNSFDGLTPPTRTRSLRYDGESVFTVRNEDMVPLLNVGVAPSSTQPKEFINSLPTPTDSFTMKCTMSKEGITLDSIAESPDQEMVNPIMPIPLPLPMPISPKEELLKQTADNTNTNSIYHHTSSSNASYPSPQTINRNKATGSEIKNDSISILQPQQQQQQQQQQPQPQQPHQLLTEEPTPMPTPINNPVVQTSFINTLPNSNIESTPLTSTTAISDELVNEVIIDTKEMKKEVKTKVDLLTYTDLLKEASIQNKDLSMNDLLSDTIMKFPENENKSNMVKRYTEPLLEELKSNNDTILTFKDLLDEASIQNKKITYDDLITEGGNNNSNDAIVKAEKKSKTEVKLESKSKIKSESLTKIKLETKTETETETENKSNSENDTSSSHKSFSTTVVETSHKTSALIESIRKEYTFKKHSKPNNKKEKKEKDSSSVKTLKKEETTPVKSVEKKDNEKPKVTAGLKRKEVDSVINTNEVKKPKLEKNEKESSKSNKITSVPSKTKTKAKAKSITTTKITSTTDYTTTTFITTIETTKNSEKRSNEEASKEEVVTKKKKHHKQESSESKKKSKETKSKDGKTGSNSKLIITKVKYNCNNISLYDSELKALVKYQTKDEEDVYPLRCICEGDIDEKEATYGLDDLVCSYPNCNKVFSKSIHLEKHFIEHGEDFRPFQCPNCTKNFRRRYDLMRHIRIHNYIIPYRCSRCLRGFTRSDSCARHTKTRQCKYYDFNQLGMKKPQPPYYSVVKDPEEKNEKEIIIVPLNKGN